MQRVSCTLLQEMMVRKSTNGETWVQHVLDGLTSGFDGSGRIGSPVANAIWGGLFSDVSTG